MNVEQHRFESRDGIPNSPLPLLLIKNAMGEAAARGTAEEAVRSNGWSGTWVWSVFDYWHYHTSGHEVLVCLRGRGRVGFGADGDAEVEMRPGDAVIIPAGVGHKALDLSNDFSVLGAYPPGQDGTVTRAGEKDIETAKAEISALALPQRDPTTGERPGCLKFWL